MHIDTSRFGTLACEARDLLLFPDGLIGFEHLHAWVLLHESPLSWLQAVTESEIALPVVSPFSYVADYQLQIDAHDGLQLDLNSRDQTVVLVVIAQQDRQWTLNLRAPILIRPAQRLGRQVVSNSEHSLQYVLTRSRRSARKTA